METLAATKAFSKAIKSGDLDTLRMVHDEHPEIVTTVTALGPWLSLAARRPSIPVLEELVRLGADPNLRDPVSDKNALGNAASAGHLENAVFLHSQAGAAIETHEPTANPLFCAILGRSLPVAEYLLSAGIDSTIRYSGENMRNMDAMAFALERGERAIAEAIAMHQANGDAAKADQLLDEADRVMRVNNA